MELPPCVKMSTKTRRKAGNKDKIYLNILKSLPEGTLEEILVALERGVSDYLKRTLPPKTNFDVTLSIAKKSDSVDFSAEVTIRGRLEYRGDYSKLAQDAINHVKEVLADLLEAKRRGVK